MKRLIFGMTLLMIAMTGQAQKKELSQARDNLKGNRNRQLWKLQTVVSSLLQEDREQERLLPLT